MINNKRDYLYYLEQDRIAFGISDDIKRPRWGRDEIWRWTRLLRLTEYLNNCCNKGICKFLVYGTKYYFHKKSIELGFSIPINVCEEGLYIPHYGTIVINGRAKVGKNCRIQEGVTIGDSRGGTPKIGNNVYICSGAKIMGDITIANGVIIGSQSFVNKSIEEENIAVAGIPAKKIGDHSSRPYLDPRLF